MPINPNKRSRRRIPHGFNEADFEIQVGVTDGGDFMRAVHKPSGKSTTMMIGKIGPSKARDLLLEDLFQELAALKPKETQRSSRR